MFNENVKINIFDFHFGMLDILSQYFPCRQYLLM